MQGSAASSSLSPAGGAGEAGVPPGAGAAGEAGGAVVAGGAVETVTGRVPV